MDGDSGHLVAWINSLAALHGEPLAETISDLGDGVALCRLLVEVAPECAPSGAAEQAGQRTSTENFNAIVDGLAAYYECRCAIHRRGKGRCAACGRVVSRWRTAGASPPCVEPPPPTPPLPTVRTQLRHHP